jgi:uncharacterized membrane protein YciS (DUF1049 family)
MRHVYLILLLIIVAAVVLFAMQNNECLTLRYPGRSATLFLPLLIAVVYLLSMVSGWTVVGFFERSLQRVTERPKN